MIFDGSFVNESQTVGHKRNQGKQHRPFRPSSVGFPHMPRSHIHQWMSLVLAAISIKAAADRIVFSTYIQMIIATIPNCVVSENQAMCVEWQSTPSLSVTMYPLNTTTGGISYHVIRSYMTDTDVSYLLECVCCEYY